MADEFLLGETTTFPSSYTTYDRFYLFRYQATKTAIVHSLRVCRSITHTGTAKIAIYADNAGEPGARLDAVDTATTLDAGWNTIPISDVSITSGTYYWIGINTSDIGLVVGASGTCTRRYKIATYSTFSFPNPAGSGFSSATDNLLGLAGWGALPISGAKVGLVGAGLVGSYSSLSKGQLM